MSRKGLNPYIRPVARLLSYLIPTAAIVATEKNILYPEIQVGARWAGALPILEGGQVAGRLAMAVRCREAAAALVDHLLPLPAHLQAMWDNDREQAGGVGLQSPGACLGMAALLPLSLPAVQRQTARHPA